MSSSSVNKAVFTYREQIMNVPTNDNAKNEINRIFTDAKAEITKNHGTSADIASLQDAVKKKIAMLESHFVAKNESSLFRQNPKEDKSTEHADAHSNKPSAK